LPITYARTWGTHRTEIAESRTWSGIIPIVRAWKGRTSWLLREAVCPDCDGGRLRAAFLAVTIGGVGIAEACAMTVDEARTFWSVLALSEFDAAIAAQVLQELEAKLGFLHDVGLGYLTLDRAAETLSGGEAQRIRLATQLGSRLTGVIYVLDEPTIGLHPRDTARLLGTLQGLRDLGNTLVLVEHDDEVIRSADHVVDMGPGAGEHGGRIVAQGTPAEVARTSSLTGQFLRGERRVSAPVKRRRPQKWITAPPSRLHNLKGVGAKLPRGCLTVVTGVSGSGKSTLVLDVVRPHLESKPDLRVVTVDQLPIGRTPRSIPASYTGILDPIRQLFAQTSLARERGYEAGRFSFNHHTGRCPKCEGRGAILVEMHFLSDVWVPCEQCAGRRYNRETLDVRWKGLTIADVLDLRVTEALALFKNHKGLARRIQAMQDVGLGYVRLGQAATTLSGGEAQRLKLAVELVSHPTETVYLLDEPTTGLHLADVDVLIGVLHRLVDAGHMVVVIEHHLDVVWNADHVIDLGPEGGAGGGEILAACDPVALLDVENSATGQALRARFARTDRIGPWETELLASP
jgi:excinuclease ABC subunit A